MRVRASRAKRRGRSLLAGALLAALLSAAPRASADAASAAEALAAAAEPGSTMGAEMAAEMGVELDQLLDEELHGDPDELWQRDPTLALRVMLLRAGRNVPAAVSAARRTERDEARARALEWLRARLADDPSFGPAWARVTAAQLAAPDQGVLWRATARTLGRLGQTDLAGELGRGLGSPRPEVVQAARAALFDLFVEWFDDAAAFDAFWIEHGAGCRDTHFRERLEQYERQNRQLTTRLLELDPTRAAATLASPDPRLRAAAVRVLPRGIAGDTAEVARQLLAHLAQEPDGMAFQATVEALLETQTVSDPAAPALVELRALLARVVEEGSAELAAPAAHALGRLGWEPSAEGEASVLRGLELLARQLTRLMEPGSLADRDTVVITLQALSTLGEAARSAELDTSAVLAPVREVVLRAIQEEREYAGVRIAAARLFATVGRPEDVALAVTVMDAPDTPAELGYTLLGVVGELARGIDPADPQADRLLDTLLERLGRDDADLRRRALSFLSDPALAPLVRRADPARFLKSLAAETLPDLQTQLLTLVAELGGPEHVALLLQLDNFDAIANGGPAGVAQLVQTARRLSDGDAALRLAAAERLLQVPNDANRVSRLREALSLVAELDEVAAAALPPAGHAAIAAWARELRQSGGALPGGAAFLRRLIDVHVAACLAAPDADGANLEHLQALFLTDLLALDAEAVEPAQVLAHFERALQAAVAAGRTAQRLLVLRDRARFHLLQGQEALALADYRAVFAAELGVTPAGPSILDLADLRRGGDLIAASTNPEDDPESDARTAREALHVSTALLRREAWASEPAAVRLRDLRDLAQRALRSRTLEALDLAAAALLELPPLPPPPAEGEAAPELPPSPEGAPWAGLLEDRAAHQALLADAEALATLRATLVGEAEAQVRPETAPPVETPPVDETPAPPPSDTGDGEGASPASGPGAPQTPDSATPKTSNGTSRSLSRSSP
ncbi:MAG: hypothetical protein H6828_07640 [Planctomycetes bacterium]|nr:hypothetical protein [Planctomycetota bacterium]